MGQRTQAIASIYMLLVLSLHPVDAYRKIESQERFATLGQSQNLMDELHQALQEDTQGSAAEENEQYPGEYFASCSRRKDDFERRAQKTKARYDEAMADGKMDALEGAWVVVKARLMSKTLQKAQTKGCEWVTEKSVKKTDLQSLVSEMSGNNKCIPAAKSILDAASEKTAEEQGKAVKDALTMLLSDDCQAQDIPATNINVDDAVKEGAEDLEEGAEDLEDKALSEAKKSSLLQALQGNALLHAEGFQPEEVSKLLSNTTTERTSNSVLLETLERVQSGNGLGEIFAKIFGFIILCILWALFCWVILAIFMVILGLIMCLFKIIIVGIMRLFGSDKWDFDYGGCVKFWVGALGHDGGSGSFGIALCAASMMSGHR